VLLALAVALLAVTPPRAAAGDSAGLAVTSPAPAPGAAVPAGPTELRAWVDAHGLAAAALSVDGVPVPGATVTATDPARGSEVSASATLSAGTHEITLDATHASGRSGTRTWTVTASGITAARIAGSSRVGTAVAVSTATYPADGTATAAVLARADDFADALAGVPLAVAVDGPLLLSDRAALSGASAAELRRMLPPGATVHLLGGREALGPGVARDVANLGFVVRRHSGAERFATAAAIAAELPASRGAVLASGTSFPDALAASVPAGRDGLPVLLTTRDALPAATAAALAERGGTVTIAGGVAAVGAEVEAQVRSLADDVRRVAGPDRYATAAAIAEAFHPAPSGVSLASGTAFPDALSGARHAVANGQPLLLTAAEVLPAATDAAVRARQPEHLDVYGGLAAVGDGVVAAARRGALDGADAARLTLAAPAAGSTVRLLDALEVRTDRMIDADQSSVHVSLDGAELASTVVQAGPTDALTITVDPGQLPRALDVAQAAELTLRLVGSDGRAIAHELVPFTLTEPDPVYATAGAIPLRLPSRDVDMIGYHQAGHRGAQAQDRNVTATPTLVLPSRGRGTGATTAADIVANPALPVLAPVSGRVIRASRYVLYCRHTDEFAVIAPDVRPDWEVKILHVDGLRVTTGDRVEAGETVIAGAPRALPFASQVDEHSSTRWPHVHVEVVDPSVPNPPGGSC
jgi:putative cell wall-binding protein